MHYQLFWVAGSPLGLLPLFGYSIQYRHSILRNVQYNIIQYNTIQYNTIYNTIQYNTIQYNTIKCSAYVFLILLGKHILKLLYVSSQIYQAILGINHICSEFSLNTIKRIPASKVVATIVYRNGFVESMCQLISVTNHDITCVCRIYA